MNFFFIGNNVQETRMRLLYGLTFESFGSALKNSLKMGWFEVVDSSHFHLKSWKLLQIFHCLFYLGKGGESNVHRPGRPSEETSRDCELLTLPASFAEE
jgi:hypothetical protein